jgi:hypothetical protein
MALNINATITTDEGFEVTNAFGYLNIYILAPESNWANISYFKSKADYEANKQPLNVSTLPSNVQTELTSTEFWGDALATTVHNKCIEKIEEVTGADTCTIDQD